ncbi:PRP21 [Candida jiufengensis]|uniref:PRP21 n=1 Tax=Candida jiufengensis TaxID=497108 RepID=UPI0022258533|nr:PRP21 [Candida jiufengensis]KAI5955082.1 PRP21 [Candida jiufengensis]
MSSIENLLPNDIKLPPKEIQETIDKTITYIIKNGKSFEERLTKNNTKKDNQFGFLKTDSEYHKFYLNQLAKASEQTKNKSIQEESTVVEEEITQEIPKPDELTFLIDEFPENLTTKDLKIIKTTALYISINSTLETESIKITNLLYHESKRGKSAQFEFLKNTHSLNPIFKIYLNQYRLLNSMFTETSKELENLNNLYQTQLDNKFNLLTKSYNRALYIKQNHQKSKQKAKSEKEKLLNFASINWQDFSILSIINFNQIDKVKELNEPISRDSLIQRSLTSKTKEIELKKSKIPLIQNPIENDKNDKSKDFTTLDSPESSEINKPPPIKGMKIKSAGSTRLKKQKNSQTSSTTTSQLSTTTTTTTTSTKIKCPITGKLIPQQDFDQHLKNLLRDPSYKQQQENYLKKNFSYESNISTDQVFNNIKRLMKKRNFENVNGNDDEENN